MEITALAQMVKGMKITYTQPSKGGETDRPATYSVTRPETPHPDLTAAITAFIPFVVVAADLKSDGKYIFQSVQFHRGKETFSVTATISKLVNKKEHHISIAAEVVQDGLVEVIDTLIEEIEQFSTAKKIAQTSIPDAGEEPPT